MRALCQLWSSSGLPLQATSRLTAHRAAATAASASGSSPAPASEGDLQRLYNELKYKVGYMGACNHKQVGVRDLFQILQGSRTPDHYKLGLQAMNMFYNFGIPLKHREIATRLLAAAMVCKLEGEAVELIKLYGTWLEKPPEKRLVYAVMGHFLDAGQPLVVREIAKAVREDWRMPVEAPLYILSIEAMLRLPENALEESMLLHRDAATMGVRLPAQVHTRLIERGLLDLEALQQSVGAGAAEEGGDDEATGEGDGDQSAEVAGVAVHEEPDTPASSMSTEAGNCLQLALEAALGLQRDGLLRGDTNSATLCALAWLLWHLKLLGHEQRTSLLAQAGAQNIASFLGGSWERALEAAVQNFGSHWGFAPVLPAGLFRTLEASSLPEAASWAKLARIRFGRFYPAG